MAPISARATRYAPPSTQRDAKAAIARYAESPDDVNTEAIERGVRAFGQAILNDPALMAKIDGWLIEAAASLIERYQDEVGGLIAATVKRWDPQATSRRIELAIGRDLQFIRINGTLVGGLAGMMLYLLSNLL